MWNGETSKQACCRPTDSQHNSSLTLRFIADLHWVKDGKEPGEDGGVLIQSEDTKHPGQTKEGEEDDGSPEQNSVNGVCVIVELATKRSEVKLETLPCTKCLVGSHMHTVSTFCQGWQHHTVDRDTRLLAILHGKDWTIMDNNYRLHSIRHIHLQTTISCVLSPHLSYSQATLTWQALVHSQRSQSSVPLVQFYSSTELSVQTPRIPHWSDGLATVRQHVKCIGYSSTHYHFYSMFTENWYRPKFKISSHSNFEWLFR